jgi:hypothetical protein
MLKLKDKVRVVQIPKHEIEFSFEKLSLVDKCVEVVGMRWDSVFNEWFYGVDDTRLKTVQWFREKYLYLIEEEKMSEFKVGDRVRVVRKVERENGWENGWLPDMNIAINTGYVFTIADISKEGIYFKRDWGTIIGGYALGYPPSSLELVESVKSKIATSTNFQYLNGAKLGSGGPLSDLCLTILTTITKYPDGSAMVDWAVAFKHPKDKFNKELARQAVLTKQTKELILSKGYNRNDIILKILADLLYHDAYLSVQYRAYVLFLVAQYSTNILRKALFK